MTYTYRADQELPAMTLTWRDADGAIIDFSSGWTPTVKVAAATAPTTTLLTKTAGITLAATAPNYQIDWTLADLATLAGSIVGSQLQCVVFAYCRRDSDSKDRLFAPGAEPKLLLLPAAD